MSKISYVSVLLWTLVSVGEVEEVRAAELIDEFDAEELNTCNWSTIQSDYPRLLRFEEERVGATTRRYLANIIDENRENETKPSAPCLNRALSLDLEESIEDRDRPDVLGPSLIFSDSLRPLRDAPGCVTAERRNGKTIVQRNELRFRFKAHRHPIDKPHWYHLVVKADGNVPTCGSTRWVTAQWKYDDPRWPDDAGFAPSPFLAQRFDNGVMHVTVQNGQCRCMVAKAAGDPDLDGTELTTAHRRPRTSDLRVIKPLKCLWTGDKTGTCEPDGAFQVLAMTSPVPPPLPDPKKDWVSMMYRVKASHRGQGEIDVYANGHLIVRVKGLIGYPWGKPGPTKFKFGHYRDKIPGEARLLYDRICLSENAAKCDDNLQIIE